MSQVPSLKSSHRQPQLLYTVALSSTIIMSTLDSPRPHRSLRLPSKPLHAPVPPSLADSKYLTSPQSIFRRTISDSHLPSQEDEEWLRDLVPQPNHHQGSSPQRLSGVVLVVRRTDDVEGALRGRDRARRGIIVRSIATSVSSPPLVRKRLSEPTPSRASNWLQRTTSFTSNARVQQNA